MRMHRNVLKQLLHNQPLVETIRLKRMVGATKDALAEALPTLRDVGVDGSAIAAVQAKFEEYQQIVRGYAQLLEDTFAINWQAEAVIWKYVGYSDSEIDKLPESVER